MKITFFFFMIVLILPAKASFIKHGNGASNVGLSLSGSASKFPDFCVLTNPSQITGNPAFEFFFRNYYGINELNQFAINSEFSILNQTMGIGIMRFGNNLYSETEMDLGISYPLYSNFLLGLSISTYFLQIKNYGDTFSFGINASICYELYKKLRIAAIINNLNEPILGASGEKIPLTGILGLSYSPIQAVEVLLDTFKEEFFKFVYRCGIRINVLSNINLLTGFQNSINSFSAGLELNQNSYAIKYSVDIHPVLNASHAIGFKYVL